jgi:hypothetical protein
MMRALEGRDESPRTGGARNQINVHDHTTSAASDPRIAFSDFPEVCDFKNTRRSDP